MAFDIDYVWCVLIMSVLTGIYVIAGGYMATAINDFIQGLIMLGGIIAVIAAVLNLNGGLVGSMSALAQVNDANALNGTVPGIFSSFFGPEPVFLLGVVILTSLGTWGLPQMVGTFGVLYNYDDRDGEEELEDNGDQIWENVSADFGAFSGGHGRLAAFAFMLFNLLCAPCFAAMGAIKREMNNAKWTCFAIGYMCVFAYVTALIVYQLGLVFAGGIQTVGLISALALLAFLLYMLFRPYKEATRLTEKVRTDK